MTDDIVARLRADAKWYRDYHPDSFVKILVEEGADEIEKLRADLEHTRAVEDTLRKLYRSASEGCNEAWLELEEANSEIKRLRAALEPFACKCGSYRCAIHGDGAVNYDKCAARIARAALAEEKKNEN